MAKPIIGVIPLWDDERESIWMLPGYLDAIRLSGGVPIILPLEGSTEDIQQIAELCSGFLLTGGHDVNPALYGAESSDKCGVANEKRDNLEREIFDYALHRDLPILGICRGIQLINALCGGTLYQDLPTERQGVIHQMRAPYDRVCHRVEIIPETPLFELLDCAEIGVNSYHHQAIKSLAPELEAMAISEDGLIEAIRIPSKSFVWAVQWHPEFNFHTEESSRKIMRSFIDACTSKEVTPRP